MDWIPGTDMYIGIGLGFLFILIAGWIVGIPARDLGLLALVFLAAAAAFILILKRRKR